MKCYYCKNECEGFVFEQGDFSVFAHRNCAVEQVDKYGNLQKEIVKMRCLKCLKNNIPKLHYCSGCGSPLPTDVTTVNIPEPFLSVIEKQQKEIERLKDIVIGNESYIEKLENNIDEYEEEVDDQSVWADTYFKKLQELKEKVRQYEMMYHNTGAMFNRMTMKEKIERYEKALREINNRLMWGNAENACCDCKIIAKEALEGNKDGRNSKVEGE